MPHGKRPPAHSIERLYERAWTALSARFASIAALNKMIVPYPGGIRLRAGAASPADAEQQCDMLKAAGESCFIAR